MSPLAQQPVQRVEIHVGEQSDQIADDADDGNTALVALPRQRLDDERITDAHPQPLGQPVGEQDAFGRHRYPVAIGVEQAPQFAADGTPRSAVR